jgi:hypothetical protein
LAVTQISDLSSAVKTKFIKKLRDKIKGQDAFTKYASSGKMERGEGDTVTWNRLLRLARQTTYNLVETDVSITEKEFVSNKLSASIGYMGDAVKLTTAAKQTSIIDDETYSDEVADQIIRSREYVGLKEISRYGLHHRVDNDATYEVNATVTTATSTTVFGSSTLTENDNHWGEDTAKVGYCCGTNPEAANYDNSSLITDFDLTGGTPENKCVTLAFPQNNSTSTKFHIVRGTGIVVTDKLTCAALARVAGLGELLQWKRFPGGIYRGFIDPGQHADLMTDSTYASIVTGVEGLKELARYQVFRAYGIELTVVPDVFREDADGTENTAGAVHSAPIFGADSYNITRWSDGEGAFGVKTNFLNKADSGNLFGFVNWIVWSSMSAVKTLNATNICVLMTGATAQAVVV